MQAAFTTVANTGSIPLDLKVRCMALKLARLQSMSDEELVRTYDEMAPSTMVGLDWYREELNRRAYERDTEAMHSLTEQAVRLTEQTVRLTEQTVRLTRVSIAVAIFALIVAVISLWR
jgi:hypothetical protein